PMGMKEYGGIIYIASYNPDTKECEVGSFPSPERDITGSSTIEDQTGLIDGNFITDDFKLSILRLMPDGEFIPEQDISKIQKLNEESVLSLNPGDRFIVTWDLNTVLNPNPGAIIIDDDNFNDYFNVDDDKKLFQIKFYKIDLNNNISSFVE